MNVGGFDATGKPSKQAAICFRSPVLVRSEDICDYLSDLGIAARFAAAIDNDAAPAAGPTGTTSRQPQPLVLVGSSVYCKSASCTDENRCRDKVGGNHNQTATECQRMLMHRFLTPSLPQQ